MAGFIENELKYVLKGHAALEAALAAMVQPELLRAGYLSDEARIREEDGPQGAVHIFTFKRRLPTGRNVEIPCVIDRQTFGLLWPETRNRLGKRRYSLPDGDVKWDIDFFTAAEGHVYFALAEVEMPPEMEAPERVLPVLAPHVAWAVPRHESSLVSSRALASEPHAIAVARRFAAGS
jgi:hypothetical protein